MVNRYKNITYHQEKSKPHLLEWLAAKRQEITKVKNVKKQKLLCTIGGNSNWCNH